jgi:endonuclease VIII-like 1
MPEGPEIRIMSDFINSKVEDKKFIKAYHVHKGNIPIEFEESQLISFTLKANYKGKKLLLFINSSELSIPVFIFMGMSGSWKWVETKGWQQTKFTRLRFDTDDGFSLIMFGGYMGPKYSLYENFKNSNSGPDIINEFDSFKSNVLNSLEHKTFKKPIYEVLLDQKYFNGVGNYLRSTILYYANVNPFLSAKTIIEENDNFFELCRDALETSYQFNGGQLKDWSNPFEKESKDFENWVYYKKGSSIKDSQGRTFWYDSKWKV